MSLAKSAVVLISFPFTDGVSAKRRPALVMFNNGDNDLLLARITTQANRTPYDCELRDWRAAGLKAASFVRLHKMATLEQRLVEGQLGVLTAADWQDVLRVWEDLCRAIQSSR